MSNIPRDAAIVDFESYPIQDRPAYPPEPVGVALDVPGKKPRYLAWAHPGGGNTCTFGEARAALAEVWASGRPVGFHNAKFDLVVAYEKMGLPALPWERVHDTMLLLYLDDPRSVTFSLKPSAERLLGEAPDERDEMIDWLVEHVRLSGHRLSESPKSDWYAGAFVAYAPVPLAGRYAVGDVTRTRGLLRLLHKRVVEERRMGAAYDRERRLIHVMHELEAQGIRIAADRLERDLTRYTEVFGRIDEWLCRRLRVASDTNLNSTEALAAALLRGKAIDRTRLERSRKTGKYLTNKEAIEAALIDEQVGAMLIYRSKLKTDLTTFMGPWLETARGSGGYIFTSWFSTRSDDHGTRTGRFSSSPNFQNLPKETEPLFYHEKRKGHPEDDKLPRCPLPLPALPLIRGYVIPYEDDDVLIDRDYSQQELRILGHFEDGPLLAAYRENPWMDVHDHTLHLVNDLLNEHFPRKIIKNTNFGIVYGLGLEKLARKSKCTVTMADKVRKAVRRLYPGVQVITAEMKRKEAAHEPLKTWGGREYFCEEPRLVELPNGAKKLQTYGYRMLNLLIQGSAADCTKEALLQYWDVKPRGHRVLTIPHDELLVSVPRRDRDRGMRIMREAMESVEFDVPMLSEGKWGTEDWAHLEAYDKAGKRVEEKAAS
jgi:DNA polymerase I